MSRSFGLVAALTFMTFLFAAPVPAAPNEAQDVRNAVLGFQTTWNQHDMAGFGKLFAPDADFVNVGGFQMKGRQDIQMNHAWSHGTVPENSIPNASRAHYGIFRHSTMRFLHVDVRFLRNDVAIAHVNWELLGDARTPKPRRGLLTFVLTRRDSEWLIAAGQNTEIDRTVR